MVTKTTFFPEKTITLLSASLDGNKHDGRQKQKVTSLYTYTHARARRGKRSRVIPPNTVSLTHTLSLSQSHPFPLPLTHSPLSLSRVPFIFIAVLFFKHFPYRSIYAWVWFSRSLPRGDSRPWPFLGNVSNKNPTPKSRWTTGHRTICIHYYDCFVDSISQLKFIPCTSRRRNEFKHDKPIVIIKSLNCYIDSVPPCPNINPNLLFIYKNTHFNTLLYA